MLPALINQIAHLTEIFSSRYFVTRTLTLVIFTHEMNIYHFVLIFPSQKWHFYSSLSLQRCREARLHSTHMSQGQGGPKNKIFTVLFHNSFFFKKLSTTLYRGDKRRRPLERYIFNGMFLFFQIMILYSVTTQ